MRFRSHLEHRSLNVYRSEKYSEQTRSEKRNVPYIHCTLPASLSVIEIMKRNGFLCCLEAITD
jgi:hypothetical protein